MSNIKRVRIVADVPFDYLDWRPDGDGLPAEEAAFLAATLLGPSIGLTWRYTHAGFIPNDHGGQTAMYRLSITGKEALPWPYMKRLAMALKQSSPLARLHIAEAKDIENRGSPWAYVVDATELSGEAEAAQP